MKEGAVKEGAVKEGEGRGAGSGLRRVRIWDRPTRIFHWVLVVLVVVCYVSGDNGRYDVHVPAGQALLILVLARVLWGFVGSEPSRFRAFVRPPREIASYLRTLAKRAPGGRPGHNPLGGLSVVAMLLVLLLQAGLGLFAVDVDGLHEGPLSFAVQLRHGARGGPSCMRTWWTSSSSSWDCTSPRSSSTGSTSARGS